MIALFCLFLTLSVSPFKSKSRLGAENAALRHQLIVLQRRIPPQSINSSAPERIPDSRPGADRPPENLNKGRAGARLFTRVCSSVANLDAGPIPNAPIPIPNGGASGPIAFGRYVDGSGRNVNGRWLIVAGAARYRRSKQCTNCQGTHNAGGYLTTPCNRSPGCKRQTKTACDQQTD